MGGLSARPVLLNDLLLGWAGASADGSLQAVRLRSDPFDVRALAPGIERATDAFRALVERLVARTGAAPLPDREAALGHPFRQFDDLSSYERDVLGLA